MKVHRCKIESRPSQVRRSQSAHKSARGRRPCVQTPCLRVSASLCTPPALCGLVDPPPACLGDPVGRPEASPLPRCSPPLPRRPQSARKALPRGIPSSCRETERMPDFQAFLQAVKQPTALIRPAWLRHAKARLCPFGDRTDNSSQKPFYTKHFTGERASESTRRLFEPHGAPICGKAALIRVMIPVSESRYVLQSRLVTCSSPTAAGGGGRLSAAAGGRPGGGPGRIWRSCRCGAAAEEELPPCLVLVWPCVPPACVWPCVPPACVWPCVPPA